MILELYTHEIRRKISPFIMFIQIPKNGPRFIVQFQGLIQQFNRAAQNVIFDKFQSFRRSKPFFQAPSCHFVNEGDYEGTIMDIILETKFRRVLNCRIHKESSSQKNTPEKYTQTSDIKHKWIVIRLSLGRIMWFILKYIEGKFTRKSNRLS